MVLEELDHEHGMVINADPEVMSPVEFEGWESDELGVPPKDMIAMWPERLRKKLMTLLGDYPPLRITWVVVDPTFAIQADRSALGFAHGAYTPFEQEMGTPVPESDTYSFGATLYYAITGRDLPSFRARMRGADEDVPFVTGGSMWITFAFYLDRLISLEPASRAAPRSRLPSDTHTGGWTGTVALESDRFLMCDLSRMQCHIATKDEVVERHLQIARAIKPKHLQIKPRDKAAWSSRSFFDHWALEQYRHVEAWGSLLNYKVP